MEGEVREGDGIEEEGGNREERGEKREEGGTESAVPDSKYVRDGRPVRHVHYDLAVRGCVHADVIEAWE